MNYIKIESGYGLAAPTEGSDLHRLFKICDDIDDYEVGLVNNPDNMWIAIDVAETERRSLAAEASAEFGGVR